MRYTQTGHGFVFSIYSILRQHNTHSEILFTVNMCGFWSLWIYTTLVGDGTAKPSPYVIHIAVENVRCDVSAIFIEFTLCTSSHRRGCWFFFSFCIVGFVCNSFGCVHLIVLVLEFILLLLSLRYYHNDDIFVDTMGIYFVEMNSKYNGNV